MRHFQVCNKQRSSYKNSRNRYLRLYQRDHRQFIKFRRQYTACNRVRSRLARTKARLIVQVNKFREESKTVGVRSTYYHNWRARRLPRGGQWRRRVHSRMVDRTINFRATRGRWPRVKLHDFYASTHIGYIWLRKTGSYTFETISDDGSKLYLNGRLIVNNDGLHSMRRRTGQIRVYSGWFELRVEFFEHGGGAGLQAIYAGPGISRRIIPASNLFVRPPCEKANKGKFDFVHGITTTFFGDWRGRKLPVGKEWKRPVTNKVVTERLWYPPTSARWPGSLVKNFYATISEAYLRIDRPGRYLMETYSDDGSKLYIDGNLIVDNDGLHGWRRRYGYISVSRGYYKLRVEFFEHGGGHGLGMVYSGPGLGRQVIPPRALWTRLSDVKKAKFPKGQMFGLQGTYYKDWTKRVTPSAKEFEKLEQEKKQVLTRVEPRIYFNPTGGHWPGVPVHNNYAAKYEGYLIVPQDGKYALRLDSDDGSRLLIDGKPVVNNDGLHGMRHKYNWAFLRRGYYQIRINFFEHGGGAGLRFYWIMRRGGWRVVTANYLRTTKPAKYPRGKMLYRNGAQVTVYNGWTKGRLPRGNEWKSLNKFQQFVSHSFYFPNMHDIRVRRNFASAHEAYLSIPRTGSWDFLTYSDDGSRLIMNGKEIVSNDGLHGMRWRMSKTSLWLRAGYYKLRCEFFQHGGGAGLYVMWRHNYGGWGHVPNTHLFVGKPPEGMPKGTQVNRFNKKLKPGLNGRYYGNYGWRGLHNINWFRHRGGNLRRVTPRFLFRPTGGHWPGIPYGDRYAAYYEGYVKIPRSGHWVFWTCSDDGSHLYIDGHHRINNDGLHGMRWRGAGIHLMAGDHRIEVTYFEHHGGAGLYVDMAGPWFGRRNIPPSMLKRAN